MDDFIDSITLNGKEILYKDRILLNSELRYYPENPRIYSIVCDGNGDPSQEEIEERLSSMDHVNQLIQSIKANGGLIDPLLVRDGDYLVLEGNSRLAAYRILSKKDPIKWGKIKCRLLPSDMGEDLIFALLGEYHIIGRKDWAPYEQAGYVWRRVKKHSISADKIASEMGISSKMIKHLINVYQFMVDSNDTDVQKWSYYDEFLKSTKIAKRRQEYPEFDKVFVDKIKKGEISKAVDVRDKVKKIAEIGGKTFKKFISTPNSLETCMDRAISRGADNVIYKRLNTFRIQIYEPDLKNDLKVMPENQINKCKFELEKIKARVDKLLKALKSD